MFGNTTLQPTIVSMNSMLYPLKYDQIDENVGQIYFSACIGVYAILVEDNMFMYVRDTDTCTSVERTPL